jgi:NAD+ kinase
MSGPPKMAFLASNSAEAAAALADLAGRYGQHEPAEADIIVPLGGDGFLLECFHKGLWNPGKPAYGMNFGSVGFLLNPFRAEGLAERIEGANRVSLHPLKMTAHFADGGMQTAFAVNEVSLLRQRHQAAKLRLSLDGRVRLPELVCDGALVCTPAGSTAYNLSAHGPILPLGSDVLALTPISAFRPRRWRGAILPHTAQIRIEVLEPEKRPVSAVADAAEMRDVLAVEIEEMRDIALTLLFDPGEELGERIIKEQFTP